MQLSNVCTEKVNLEKGGKESALKDLTQFLLYPSENLKLI